MRLRRELSIRARLTLFFVASIAVVLTFTGVALVSLVHRTLEHNAGSQVVSAMAQTEAQLATQHLGERVVSLPMHGDVVVQVTNPAGTRVWAASSAIIDAPVLARARPSIAASTGYDVVASTGARARTVLSQLSQGLAQSLVTSRGPGLIFGYVYGTSINHSVGVLLASVAVSFPLLLLLSGGLIWLGIGLALAPVESIRRRVDAIAARDLSERVPLTGGDDEIARLARTVNEMLDRLEVSSTFQQEFVSNASHELRSPLTTLLATAQRAADDPARADWPTVAEVILREGRRLDGLIDNLFWLARHDERRLEVRRVDVDLDDILFEEATRIRTIHELEVDTSEVQPTRVMGDPDLFKRMIRNVVDNAARYAHHELRLASSYDGDSAVVRVADDGDGVDVATSARFFERFVRADPARTRQSGGTGLGLSIVTDIVRRYGGAARFVEVASGSLVELRVRVDVAAAGETA